MHIFIVEVCCCWCWCCRCCECSLEDVSLFSVFFISLILSFFYSQQVCFYVNLSFFVFTVFIVSTSFLPPSKPFFSLSLFMLVLSSLSELRLTWNEKSSPPPPSLHTLQSHLLRLLFHTHTHTHIGLYSIPLIRTCNVSIYWNCATLVSCKLWIKTYSSFLISTKVNLAGFKVLRQTAP